MLPSSSNNWWCSSCRLYTNGDKGRVIGLSKLNRIVEHFARRGAIQEQLTEAIHQATNKVCEENNLGVIVTIVATHNCVVVGELNIKEHQWLQQKHQVYLDIMVMMLEKNTLIQLKLIMEDIKFKIKIMSEKKEKLGNKYWNVPFVNEGRNF